MDGLFRDEIEITQIEKFFCNEMGRQIHRYIKAHGSMTMLESVEKRLDVLPVPEREHIMTRYIDRNRRLVENMDWRMLVARSMANFCDSYDYFEQMIADKDTMTFYVERFKGIYLRFHKIVEQDGKYGMVEYDGRVLLHPQYDFLRTPYVYVDDLLSMPVIAEKNGKMGLVMPDGKDTVVVPFEYDDISLRDEAPWFELTKGNKTTLWDNLAPFI
jgi:hypothetical protein